MQQTSMLQAAINGVTQVYTGNMSRDKWLEARRAGIGGSDAGAIMGLSKYDSALSVFLKKRYPVERKATKATDWGNVLEDAIRVKTSEELGLQIEPCPSMLTNIVHPFMIANLDGLFIKDGKLCGFEAKTTTRGDGFGDEEIPDSYYCQVQHYMAVTGLSEFLLTCFFLGSKTAVHYPVKRDEEFIARLIDAESEFWTEHVKADVAPAPRGLDSEDELLDELAGRALSDAVLLGDEFVRYIELDTLAAASEKATRDARKTSKVALKMAILKAAGIGSEEGVASKIVARCGGYEVSYTPVRRRIADTEALKNAHLFEQYSKESVAYTLRIKEARA